MSAPGKSQTIAKVQTSTERQSSSATSPFTYLEKDAASGISSYTAKTKPSTDNNSSGSPLEQ